MPIFSCANSYSFLAIICMIFCLQAAFSDSAFAMEEENLEPQSDSEYADSTSWPNKANRLNSLALGYLVAIDRWEIADISTHGNATIGSRPSAGAWGRWRRVWSKKISTHLLASWRSVHWRPDSSRAFHDHNQEFFGAGVRGQYADSFFRWRVGLGFTEWPVVEAVSQTQISFRKAIRAEGSTGVAVVLDHSPRSSNEVYGGMFYMLPGSSNGVRSKGASGAEVSWTYRRKNPWGSWLAKLAMRTAKMRTNLIDGRQTAYSLDFGIDLPL